MTPDGTIVFGLFLLKIEENKCCVMTHITEDLFPKESKEHNTDSSTACVFTSNKLQQGKI